MLATTVDEVIERLEGIIKQAMDQGSRLGYFAALYNRVTQQVRDGILRGDFEDNQRMERLDVIFANRYLAAYDEHQAGALPSRSWQQAFAAAGRDDLLVLHHLLLGMNAHIDLDLGIAAASVGSVEAFPGLKSDFDRINQVLASLVSPVEVENTEILPVLGGLVALAGGREAWVADRGIDLARTGAWDFAARLAPLEPAAQLPHIAARDLEVATMGEVLLGGRPLAMLIGIDESKDVRDNIQILARGEFHIAKGT